MLEMQMQIRENANELSDFLRDLDTWESDIKKQDKTFTKMKPKQEHNLSIPVRGSSGSKKKINEETKSREKPKRIKSYDFKSWDKLDVDKMMDDIDAKEAEEEAKKQEEIEKNLKQLALDEKNKGNEHFKGGRYAKAIECYSKGMQYDASNPLLPANRAMAYLKLKQFVESEADCTLALSHDPAYIKAYLRRGSARVALGKVESAVKDFKDALKLEPENKQAKQELENINKKTTKESGDNDFLKPHKKKKGLISPINKPPHMQSKKPLRRIEVLEIRQIDATKIEADSEVDVNLPKNNELNEIKDHVESTSKPLIEEINGYTEQQSTISIKKHCANTNSAPLPLLKEKLIIPPPASTCFQLQADIRKLQSDAEALHRYLLQLDFKNLSSLLKDQLDTDLLLMIIKCFHEHSFINPEFVISFLTSLAKVKRFDMAIMFLSKSDKQLIHSLKEKLLKISPMDEGTLSGLFKKYNL